MPDKLPAEWLGNEPRGTYQVWHKEADDYRHVADAEVGNLLAALVLPDMPPGTPGGELVTHLVEHPRPATFGDVIVNPLGAAYRIDDSSYGPVFQVVDFAELRNLHALFAEQREDFQMGQEEAARGEFREGVRMFAELLTKSPDPTPEPPQQDRDIER